MKTKYSVLCLLVFLLTCLLSFTSCFGLTGEIQVGNEYFRMEGYRKNEVHAVDEDGKVSDTPQRLEVHIDGRCAVGLLHHRTKVAFLNAVGDILGEQVLEVESATEPRTLFTDKLEVEPALFEAIETLRVTYDGITERSVEGVEMLSPPSQVYHRVTLIYGNGQPESVVQVKSGQPYATPPDPVREGYIFTGWYTSASLSERYDFSHPVTADWTLHAGYTVDAAALINQISRSQIRATVKVINTSYNTNWLGVQKDVKNSQGSGFCFDIDDEQGYYYILTNCHVAKLADGRSKQDFTIEDYRGKTYTAHLLSTSGQKAIDPAFDLACLRFKASQTDVVALALAEEDPPIGADVVSVGTPHGQKNHITCGQITRYKNVTLDNTTAAQSNVTFPVIGHSAYIDYGSSGGVLLDASLRVIGVNYASVSKLEEGEQPVSYAIPVRKVWEFLRSYVYA